MFRNIPALFNSIFTNIKNFLCSWHIQNHDILLSQTGAHLGFLGGMGPNFGMGKNVKTTRRKLKICT